MHIGFRIRTLIEDKNISITTLAQLMDIDRPQLYRYLKRENWDIDTLIKACGLLEVPLSDFIDDKDKKVLDVTIHGSNNTVKDNMVAESSVIYGTNKAKELEIKLQAALKEIEHLKEIVELQKSLIDKK